MGLGLLLAMMQINACAQTTHLKAEVSNQGPGLGVFLNTVRQTSGGFVPVNFPEDISGFGVGIESPLFRRNNGEENSPALALRISYECHGAFLPVNLAFRASTLYYSNFKKGAFTLRPEVGLSYGGGNIYFFYGYNVAFQAKELVPTRHQFTLGVTIPGMGL